jgi:hypothetical protein
MLLTQIRRLDIHSQVYGVWVARTEKLSIRRRIDEKKLPAKNAIGTFQKVIMISSFT